MKVITALLGGFAIALTTPSFAAAWAVGDEPEFDLDQVLVGGGGVSDNTVIIIGEGFEIELSAFAIDTDDKSLDGCPGEVDPIEETATSMIWKLETGGTGTLAHGTTIAGANGLRIDSGQIATYTAPTLGAQENSRDIDITATPDDASEAAPGSRPAGDTGNRNDAPSSNNAITITIRVVKEGPVSISQVADEAGDMTLVKDLIDGEVAANNAAFTAIGATRFEMKVSKVGAQAGDFNGYFIEETLVLHPDNSNGTFNPDGEAGRLFFNTVFGMYNNWSWSQDIIVSSVQGFVVGEPGYEFFGIEDPNNNNQPGYVLDTAQGKDDTFFDYYIFFQTSKDYANEPTFLKEGENPRYVYGRHTYAFNGAALDTGTPNDAFKAQFKYENIDTPDDNPVTLVKHDREAE